MRLRRILETDNFISRQAVLSCLLFLLLNLQTEPIGNISRKIGNVWIPRFFDSRRLPHWQHFCDADRGRSSRLALSGIGVGYYKERQHVLERSDGKRARPRGSPSLRFGPGHGALRKGGYLSNILELTRWNRAKAARMLGIGMNALEMKIRDYQLSPGNKPWPKAEDRKSKS